MDLTPLIVNAYEICEDGKIRLKPHLKAGWKDVFVREFHRRVLSDMGEQSVQEYAPPGTDYLIRGDFDVWLRAPVNSRPPAWPILKELIRKQAEEWGFDDVAIERIFTWVLSPQNPVPTPELGSPRVRSKPWVGDGYGFDPDGKIRLMQHLTAGWRDEFVLELRDRVREDMGERDKFEYAPSERGYGDLTDFGVWLSSPQQTRPPAWPRLKELLVQLAEEWGFVDEAIGNIQAWALRPMSED